MQKKSKTTPADILRTARSMIEKPDCWLKSAVWGAVVDESGKMVLSSRGVRWSTSAAINAAAKDARKGIVRDTFDYFAGSNDCDIKEFNGETDHAGILAAFDAAIWLAEREWMTPAEKARMRRFERALA